MFKKIYVEITNNCNLDCSFCIKNKRNKKFVSKDEFNLLLDKINGYTKYIYFHVMGEPLLHPNVNELVDIASTKGFFVNITTNGYLINRIENNKNVRQINISLHSFNDKYNVSLDDYLNKVFSAVDKLVDNNTFVQYRLWVNSEYAKEIKDKLYNKYNVRITDEESIKLCDNVYFSVEHEHIWPSLDNNYYNEVGSCRGTRDHIGILVDGTIIPCCLDSEGIINLGNIYVDNVDKVINSDRFINIKNGFCCNKKIEELCKKCNFYSLRK